MSEPEDAEILRWPSRRATGLHFQCADIPRASAPYQARAAEKRHRGEIGGQADSPRVEQPRAAARDEVEDAAAFLEEASAFRKEQREAVERHLLAVRLDLCEVGVHR